MSKLLLTDQELENKIHEFLVRKNADFEINNGKNLNSKIILNFSNDTAVYDF